MDKKTYYITTPIYYVNDVPHVGNAYTTIMCDSLSRYKKLFGNGSYLLTGTDENAPKVAAAANDRGIAPMDYVNQLAEQFKQTWAGLGIEFSDFIRTTEPRHMDVVRKIFSRLLQQGDIYKGSYQGWYCVPCETFWLEADLKDGKCPNAECGRPVEWVEEENYYFRLSAYTDRLLDYIEKNPEFLQPEFRKKEVVSFIKQGLRDVSITRKNNGWGIEVPDDPSKVIYVWFDALINYISAIGYLSDDDMFNKLWPAQFQAMGKDIFVRFHCTFWPAMLMALDLPLPDTLFGHGFWTINGEKISKSKGNAVSPSKLAQDLFDKFRIDPEDNDKIERYKGFALDAVRYYLARETTFGQDGDFSIAGFENRFDSDLANDLGNLVNRTLKMILMYFPKGITSNGCKANGLTETITQTAQSVKDYCDHFDFSRALEEVWQMIGTTNKYVNDRKPWVLYNPEPDNPNDELAGVLYSAVQAIWAATVMVSPFMPNTAIEIRKQLGIVEIPFTWDAITNLSPIKIEHRYIEPIFPRIGIKPIKIKSDGTQNKEKSTLPESMKNKDSKKPKEDKKVEEQTPKQPEAAASTPAAAETPSVSATADTPVVATDTITYDHFSKLKIRVAEVISAEKVEGADKLLKLQVSLGDEQRQIVAGVAMFYAPDQIVGKKIVMLTNLEPAKIRGVVSNGMLLAADVDGRAVLLTPDTDVPAGSKVK